MRLLTRTFSIKILDGSRALYDTLLLYNKGLNIVGSYAYDNKVWSSIKLHNALYHKVREEINIKSQFLCSIFRQVAAAYKRIDKKKQAEIRKKKSNFFTLSMILQGGVGRDWSFLKNGLLSISTVCGRIKVKYNSNKHTSKYMDGSWNYGSARLIYKRDNYYLNISCTKEVENVLPQTTIVGVDIGINNLAVLSTVDNKSIFFKGGEIKNRSNHYNRITRSLQIKGTRGSKKVLKRMSGKRFRFVKDSNHCISKKIVSFSVSSGNSLIALENLTGITRTRRVTKRYRNTFHTWPFYQLRHFITYKASAYGMDVIVVDPRNTSKGCSRCGHVSDNQRNGSSFKCKACGFQLHADLNASRNIAQRARLARQVLASPGSPSMTPKAASVDVEARKGIEAEGSCNFIPTV